VKTSKEAHSKEELAAVTAARNRDYYQKNKEKLKQQTKSYYLKNRQKMLNWQKAYASGRKGKIKEDNRSRYVKQREERLTQAKLTYLEKRPLILKRVAKYRKRPDVKARSRQWQKEYYSNPENKDRRRKTNYVWYAKNRTTQLAYKRSLHKKHMQDSQKKEKRKNQQATYMRQRAQTDPNFRIRVRLSGRITDAFRRQKTSKSHSALKYLGCTLAFFTRYISKQFKLGMNIENYGRVWELDHIKPCSSFDLQNDTEALKCFNFSNYQPLFVFENRQKSDSGLRRRSEENSSE
jgi:hypothetical protein